MFRVVVGGWSNWNLKVQLNINSYGQTQWTCVDSLITGRQLNNQRGACPLYHCPTDGIEKLHVMNSPVLIDPSNSMPSKRLLSPSSPPPLPPAAPSVVLLYSSNAKFSPAKSRLFLFPLLVGNILHFVFGLRTITHNLNCTTQYADKRTICNCVQKQSCDGNYEQMSNIW